MDKEIIAKLSYEVRGLFQIIRHTGRGSYYIRKLYKLDSPKLKFVAKTLYQLPPPIKLCEAIDSCDTIYPKQFYTPAINNLKKSLNIELYNEKNSSINHFIFQPLSLR